MRADRAFRQLILLALGAAGALSLPLMITLFPGTIQRTVHGYEIIVEACAAAINRVSEQLPPLGTGVLALALAGLVAGSFQAIRTLVRTRRALREHRPLESPERLARAAAATGIATRLVCFADLRPLAFCAGLLRPRVWISTGAVAVLASDELEAVLWHEAYHLRHRDPLRIFVARVLAHLLFPFPLIRGLATRFEVAKELDADQEATRAQGGVAGLAGALYALGRRPLPFAPSEVALGPWSLTRVRVDQLCGEPEEVLLPAVSHRARVCTALAFAVLLVLAGGQAARANIQPAAVFDAVAPSLIAGDVRECPLPSEGILY